MAVFATPDDIVAVWRPLTDEETTIAQGLIDQASNKIRLAARRRRKDADYLFDIDLLVRNAITAAVVNAAKRVLMNPKALRQYSETTGPFTESQTIDSSVSTGGLYVDPSDLADIFPATSGIRSFRVKAGLRF